MRFIVKYKIGPQEHTGGMCEDFFEANERCLELIKGDADSAWVETTMRSKEYLKVEPLDDDGGPVSSP